ncbi:hypothetical protein ACQP2F_13460 [Actinoplanes sp. CA-030573]|uniref:hypothetical protein n=1 Tax=Actinoplanes sp. CA-030573 TaxID=3239898 RepID=UPI003D8F6A26
MLRFIWAHVRGRPSRAVTLLLGILIATTGFTVLTGTTRAARLQVTSTVQGNSRAAYDILVRPQGARTPLEDASSLVRPNYLSGIFGGITAAQYARIGAVPGVEVAAPIAMAGYVKCCCTRASTSPAPSTARPTGRWCGSTARSWPTAA